MGGGGLKCCFWSTGWLVEASIDNEIVISPTKYTYWYHHPPNRHCAGGDNIKTWNKNRHSTPHSPELISLSLFLTNYTDCRASQIRYSIRNRWLVSLTGRYRLYYLVLPGSGKTSIYSHHTVRWIWFNTNINGGPNSLHCHIAMVDWTTCCVSCRKLCMKIEFMPKF